MDLPFNLNRLKYFVSIVEQGSFTRAAAALKQPKSRVSRNLAALERELGVQLVNRTTRQLHLTEGGRALYRDASQALSSLKQGVTRVSSRAEEIAGPLRVTTPDDIGMALMAPICAEFQKEHPKIRFELYVTNAVVDLVRDAFDIAVRIGRGTDSSLIQRRLGTVRMHLLAAPEFLDRFGIPSTVAQLSEVPTLAFSEYETKTKWILSRKHERRAVSIRPAMTSNNLFVIRDLTVRGAGIALLPGFISTEAQKAGALVPVLPGWISQDPPVSIVVPGQRTQPAKVKRFADFLALKLSRQFT